MNVNLLRLIGVSHSIGWLIICFLTVFSGPVLAQNTQTNNILSSSLKEDSDKVIPQGRRISIDRWGRRFYLNRIGRRIYLNQNRSRIYRKQRGSRTYLNRRSRPVFLDVGGRHFYIDRRGNRVYI